MPLKAFKVAKRGHTSAREQRKEDKIKEKVLTYRRKHRQMLQQVVDSAAAMKLPSHLGLPAGRVKELWALFSKSKPIGDKSARAAEVKLRAQGRKDIARALAFIDEHGIKQKQNEDMTYDPREDTDSDSDAGEQAESNDESNGGDDEEEADDEEQESMDIDTDEARAGIENLQINDQGEIEAELDAILARPAKPVKLKLICRKKGEE